ncbi:MAG: hypothetical protein GWM98_03940, partial [Nitrospinaceae bacterium]|nr:hypothetical protein [Nitrospinaceae bacterium]NIR53812.1 hypothetical protein [Nitrospinaceae bacterium]NIS84223.1 hypothetical protein [Nitrospinaceae bacterium]NIT81029.1 hypothetical protein [Nitrospinaceae bacterium]NIU43318.1 hypothetical protein [Nitrospinaceae bacterium]
HTLLSDNEETCSGRMVESLNQAGKSVFVSFLQDFARKTGKHLSTDALFAAAWMTLGWHSLKTKRISRA